MSIKEFYTKAEAARALGISRQAVHAAVKAGRIPVNDDGHLAVDDLEQWRIARIRESYDELRKRQDVPNLLGDPRTPLPCFLMDMAAENPHTLKGMSRVLVG